MGIREVVQCKPCVAVMTVHHSASRSKHHHKVPHPWKSLSRLLDPDPLLLLPSYGKLSGFESPSAELTVLLRCGGRFVNRPFGLSCGGGGGAIWARFRSLFVRVLTSFFGILFCEGVMDAESAAVLGSDSLVSLDLWLGADGTWPGREYDGSSRMGTAVLTAAPLRSRSGSVAGLGVVRVVDDSGVCASARGVGKEGLVGMTATGDGCGVV